MPIKLMGISVSGTGYAQSGFLMLSLPDVFLLFLHVALDGLRLHESRKRAFDDAALDVVRDEHDARTVII